MKVICLILSIFLFIGGTNACGLSELPCVGDTEQSSNCCKSQDKDEPTNDDQGRMACCQATVVNMPVSIEPSVQLTAYEEPVSLKLSSPILGHSYDFHSAVWQPPKVSC